MGNKYESTLFDIESEGRALADILKKSTRTCCYRQRNEQPGKQKPAVDKTPDKDSL